MSSAVRLITDKPSVTRYEPGEVLDSLIWGDALKVLPKLPDAIADMVFLDGRKNSTLSDATFNDDEVIVALPVAFNPQV